MTTYTDDELTKNEVGSYIIINDSRYAFLSYLDANYDEAYTEYRVLRTKRKNIWEKN